MVNQTPVSSWVTHTNYKPLHTHTYSLSHCFFVFSLALSPPLSPSPSPSPSLPLSLSHTHTTLHFFLPFINWQLDTLPGGIVGRRRICICIFPISPLDGGSWAYQGERKEAGRTAAGWHLLKTFISSHLVLFFFFYNLRERCAPRPVVGGCGEGHCCWGDDGLALPGCILRGKSRGFKPWGHTHANKAILVSWSSAETKGRRCQCVAASD